MISIIGGKQEGEFLSWKEYYKGRGIVAKILMPVTKRLRSYYAEQYMGSGENHLDIGCGDGYFLKRSISKNLYGMDMKYGDVFKDRLNFPGSFFDYVTMLAVIEHLENPASVFKEIHRVLKTKGKFIFTTPKQASEKVIKIYVKEISDDHESYFDFDKVKHLSMNLFEIKDYKTFILGLNQIFYLEKI